MGGFLEFLIGHWLGVRDERRRAIREAKGPQPPSSVERGTVILLRRIFRTKARGDRAASRALARDVALVAATQAAEDARARRRRRERLARAKASARRRALRKARRIAVLVVICVGVLLVLWVVNGVTERGHLDRPAGSAAATGRHKP